MHFYFDLILGITLLVTIILSRFHVKIFRQKNERDLLRTKNKMQEILNNVNVSIWSVSVNSDSATYISAAGTEKTFGLSREEFKLNPLVWKKLVHPEDLPKVAAGQKAVREGHAIEMEFRIIKPNNEMCWISIKMVGIKDKTDNITQIDGISTDITERMQLLSKIEHMALHDSLTNLPNRNLFEELCANALAKAKRQKSMLGVMFIDLDKFKSVNDTFGHAVGDILLQSVAERLKDCLRESDNVARMGGDEFAVFLADITDPLDVSRTAQRIVNEMSRPFPVNEHELSISASVGISLYPSDGNDMPTLFKKADEAMYKVKEEGKNNYQFYSR